MWFASRSLVIISVLGLLASTSAKPTYLRKGHDKQTVSTKSLRQFDPRKVPTRRAFGAAPHHSHIPTDRFNGFWEYEGTSEGDDDDYSYDFSSTSSNTLRSGPDDAQPSNADSNIAIDAAGGIPHSSTTSSTFANSAVAPDLSSSPVGLAPADSQALQNARASDSSPRGASDVFNFGAVRGFSPPSSGVAKKMSIVDGVVIDNVATVPNGASSLASGIFSTYMSGPGPALASIPADNGHPSRPGRLGVSSDVTHPRMPTSGSSASPNSIGNDRYSHPIVEAVSGSSPNIRPSSHSEVINDKGDAINIGV